MGLVRGRDIDECLQRNLMLRGQEPIRIQQVQCRGRAAKCVTQERDKDIHRRFGEAG